MNKKLVIIGAGGHGKVVADIAEKNGYNDIVFLDDNRCGKNFGNYPIVGNNCDALNYSDRDFIVGIGNAEGRKRIQEQLLKSNLNVINLIHPQAVVAKDVSFGIGIVVMAGAIINPGTAIGDGCIINTGATVDHDNVLGNYVHLSVGCHLAGTVQVGDNTWIGIGAVVNNDIKICENCVIGAGAVVINSLLDSDTYIGIPARKMIRKNDE